MSPQRRPVYWKPQYATRSMRERAWTKRQQEREEALKRSKSPSLLARIRKKLSRRS